MSKQLSFSATVSGLTMALFALAAMLGGLQDTPSAHPSGSSLLSASALAN